MSDRFVNISQVMKRDVLIDSSLDPIWLAALILKLPDFFREWIINPLASLITSEVLASEYYIGAKSFLKSQLAFEFLSAMKSCMVSRNIWKTFRFEIKSFPRKIFVK